jgi:2-amino-4-hydroxy-6-hydroxymethyldihydropteridine diphosphokinase
MPLCYISLGSNLGNRKQFIGKAEGCIQSEIGAILKKSSVYETEPWGFHHPVNFINRVLQVTTTLDPGIVLQKCLTIEKQLGRQRQQSKYEARTIDIDILFYEGDIIHSDDLQIPHPYLHLRRFILEPLNEIAPDLIHPGLIKPVSLLLSECIDKGNVVKLE